MVTTRTCTYSAAPSSKLRSKNVRFVDTRLQRRTCDPPTEDDTSWNSSMQLPQDSASLVHEHACPVIGIRRPLAAINSQLCAALPPHEITEPANSVLQRNACADTLDGSVHVFREPADSGLREGFAPIVQEPVEPGLEENGDSRQTLHADLSCEVQTAKPTLQGTQSTEPGSQEPDTGLAESPPGGPWGTTTSISEEIFTAGAAPQEEESTNCDPQDTQPTEVTPQQSQLSDLAPREPVGCDSPQETNSVSLARCETEIEIVDLAGRQEPEVASLAPYETANCIQPQEPEIPAADETADAGHCDITNVNPLMIADPPLPKLSTAEIESPKAETADLDALETKTTNSTQEPGVTNINHHETAEVITPKTADPPQEPQAALSVPQDSRRSSSEEAGHSRVLARLTIDGNGGHTDTGPTLGSLGDTNENPIVLDDSSAGDSRYNPIEIPDDPITQRSRKRRHSSNVGDGRHKFRCRTESYRRSQFPVVPWAQTNLYLPD